MDTNVHYLRSSGKMPEYYQRVGIICMDGTVTFGHQVPPEVFEKSIPLWKRMRMELWEYKNRIVFKRDDTKKMERVKAWIELD